MLQYQGQELDVCQVCGGLWFDRGEVNALIAEFNTQQGYDSCTVNCSNTQPNSQFRSSDVDVASGVVVAEQLDSNEINEWEHHNKYSGDNQDQHCYTGLFGASLGRSDIHCPCCEVPMKRFHLLEHYHTEIDICHECEGSWVDGDELPQLEHSQVLHEYLSELNGTLSWKTYLFQLLSQLPVEYNIKPQRTPWVNYGLLLLNCLLFVAYFYNDSYYNFVLANFAMTPTVVADGGQWWTMVSCIFLHGSLIHLAGNMYFLYIIGDNLEDVLGHIPYLFLYLLCGVFASFGSLFLRFGSDIPSIGASGAIAGLFGLYLIWFRHASLSFMFIVYQKKLSAVWFFVLWLGINLMGLFSLDGTVDYGAHLGGFAIGILLGLALKQRVYAANPIINLLNHSDVKLKR